MQKLPVTIFFLKEGNKSRQEKAQLKRKWDFQGVMKFLCQFAYFTAHTEGRILYLVFTSASRLRSKLAISSFLYLKVTMYLF